MEKILSDDELNALLALYQEHGIPEEYEESAKEIGSLIENDMHRRFFRIQRSLPTALHINGSTHAAVSINIGLGGVFILSDVDIPIGTRVDVDIEMPMPKKTIHAKSNICWHKKLPHNKTGLGVCFAALEIDYIWAIVANMTQEIHQ